MAQKKLRGPSHHPLAVLSVFMTAILLALSIYTFTYSRTAKTPSAASPVKRAFASAVLPDTPEQVTIVSGTVREASGNGHLTIETASVVNGVSTGRLMRVDLANDTSYYFLGPLPTAIADPYGTLPQRTKTKAPSANVAIGASVQILTDAPVDGTRAPTAREVDIYSS